MKGTWNTRGLVATALVTATMRAWSLTGGPVSGLVIDKDTSQPVAGVIVVARWNGNWTKIFGESSSGCYHAETARTDASGRYEIPRWKRAPEINDLRFSSGGYDISLFKPGYVDVSGGDDDRTLHIQRFDGTNEEYFAKVLDSRRWHCTFSGESQRHVFKVFRAAATDANARAMTPEQQAVAEHLERSAQETLVNYSKPTTYRGGVQVNVDQSDSYRPEE